MKQEPGKADPIDLTCICLHNIMSIHHPQEQNGLVDQEDQNRHITPSVCQQGMNLDDLKLVRDGNVNTKRAILQRLYLKHEVLFLTRRLCGMEGPHGITEITYFKSSTHPPPLCKMRPFSLYKIKYPFVQAKISNPRHYSMYLDFSFHLMTGCLPSPNENLDKNRQIHAKISPLSKFHGLIPEKSPWVLIKEIGRISYGIKNNIISFVYKQYQITPLLNSNGVFGSCSSPSFL